MSVYSVVKNKEFSDKTAKEISALFGEVAYFEAQQSNLDQLLSCGTDDADPGGKRKSGQRNSFNKVHALKKFTDEKGEMLPFGWEMRFTEEGEVFYANHVNRTTSWSRPEY